MNKLDQLKGVTVVVADTGDMDAIRDFRPTDSTTNPSLILKTAQMPTYSVLVDESVKWGKAKGASVQAATQRLAVNFGTELSKLVPGRVSTQVDADFSFDTQSTVDRAREIIADYACRGVDKERVLIKVASTWEGIRAAEVLQKEGIDCNLTLLFSLAQAVACGDAGVFLISPYVGRILAWHVKNAGRTFSAEEDPGVISVRNIYAYDVKTVVMGASFRNTGEIEALAGCDRLTVSPQLLDALMKDEDALRRCLDPVSAAKVASAKMNIDEKSFSFLMNEDAMTTEKLSEGVRAFAKDLRSLRDLINQRMNG